MQRGVRSSEAFQSPGRHSREDPVQERNQRFHGLSINTIQADGILLAGAGAERGYQFPLLPVAKESGRWLAQ